MIQHIKNKKHLFIYLLIFLSVYLFIGCKDNYNSQIKDKPRLVLSETENISDQIEYKWKFFNWYPIGDVRLEDNKVLEIESKYKNLELNFLNDSIFLKGKQKEALYTGNISSKKFFMRDYSYRFYEKFLKKEFNLTLKENLAYFENKNKHHKESILKEYFSEGFIIDDYLFAINESEGIIIVFKDKKAINFNSKEGSSCLKKSNLELPYNQKLDINTIQYSLVDCHIEGVFDWLCGEEELRFIPLFEYNNIISILVPMDCGDFNYRYYLLTVKNDSIVSSLYVEGEWYEPENIDDLETTSFEIDKDYLIKVKTENINGDLGVNKVKNYKINEEGKIEGVK